MNAGLLPLLEDEGLKSGDVHQNPERSGGWHQLKFPPTVEIKGELPDSGFDRDIHRCPCASSHSSVHIEGMTPLKSPYRPVEGLVEEGGIGGGCTRCAGVKCEITRDLKALPEEGDPSIAIPEL
jgi:hypothetical protein